MDWGLITQNLIQILINKVNLFNQAHQKKQKQNVSFQKIDHFNMSKNLPETTF